MNIVENILLAQDFDESSSNVTAGAIELARTFKSVITPIHILPDDILNEKTESLLKQAVSSKLENVVQKIHSNNVETAQSIIKKGVAYEAVSKTAININANIIVVGSGENREDNIFKLGTTTERIIQSSEKPVFVVKENTPLNIHTILCPVDFSETSKRALNNAIIIARRFSAHLIILSVCKIQTSSWFSSQEDLDRENDARFEKHQTVFDEFVKGFNLNDLNYSIQSPKGDPSDEILNAIASNNVDLLIIGTSDKSGLNRLLLGSVTEKVIREVPCSFITLKSEDVVSLNIKADIDDFEKLFETASQLEKDGFYQEAIEQFKACISLNTMHVPAYQAVSRIYQKLEETDKADLYKKSAHEIKERIWYAKIEEEVRKLRGS